METDTLMQSTLLDDPFGQMVVTLWGMGLPTTSLAGILGSRWKSLLRQTIHPMCWGMGRT